MPIVAIIKLGTLLGLPGTTRRKVGMTSNHHAPYVLGYTRATMVGTKSMRDREVERISKTDLSSDCRLQLACMKSELLVIVDQNATVNAFPGLVHTARHAMGVGSTQSRRANPQGRQPPKVRPMTGVKS